MLGVVVTDAHKAVAVAFREQGSQLTVTAKDTVQRAASIEEFQWIAGSEQIAVPLLAGRKAREQKEVLEEAVLRDRTSC